MKYRKVGVVMEEKRFYTAKEIAEIYNVTPYTVTQNWGSKGLKRIRGKKSSYLYKLEWVDEYIEQAVMQKTDNICDVKKINFKKSTASRSKKIQYVV